MIYRHGGHLRNAVGSQEWREMQPVQQVMSMMSPDTFDRLHLGVKYNCQLNASVEWDEDVGIAVTMERLPMNPEGVLHSFAIPAPLDEFLSDFWDCLLGLPCTYAVEYCFGLCEEAVPCVTLVNTRIAEEQYQKRKYAGHPLIETLSRGLRAW